MPQPIVPPDVAPPLSRYSHGVVHAAGARRLVISGQIGVRPDGTVAEGVEGQAQAAFDNLFAVLRAAGMGPEHLVKLTAFVTVPGSVAVYRRVREARLGALAPAATYLEVAGLASPAYLVEIEGEAVAE